MKPDKKARTIVIGVFVAIFVLSVIFAMYAGTVVGADIGEFIYNITHKAEFVTFLTIN
ncbi:MAG: hypothetical protein K2H90_07415 [Oscillospiraceae bacterium]|nr:hypothetical protein [Oscillospiraceae bacterium]